jgi:hypothetical protein
MVLKSTYSWVYVIHILVAAPLIWLTAHFGQLLGGRKGIDRSYDNFFLFVKVTAVSIVIYHLYKLISIETDILK